MTMQRDATDGDILMLADGTLMRECCCEGDPCAVCPCPGESGDYVDMYVVWDTGCPGVSYTYRLPWASAGHYSTWVGSTWFRVELDCTTDLGWYRWYISQWNTSYSYGWIKYLAYPAAGCNPTSVVIDSPASCASGVAGTGSATLTWG